MYALSICALFAMYKSLICEDTIIKTAKIHHLPLQDV
jgi:hypothetical protein